jgi:hypothetical protein
VRDALQRERYCPDLGTPNPGEILEIDGEEYRFCPVARVTGESIEAVTTALEIHFYGCLPEPGGINDQFNLDIERTTYLLGRLKARNPLG